MVKFWKDYIQDLTNKKHNYSNYKVENSITSLPLYAVQPIEEYETYIEYIDQNFNLFEEKLRLSHHIHNQTFTKQQWIFSMYPDIRGFCYFPKIFFDNVKRKIGSLETANPNVFSAVHFFRYLELTGKSPMSYTRIVELGGGLGDMALFFRNMGYVGEYIIYDLPEITKLQNLATSSYEIITTNEIPKESENTLFISTWALSECPLELRKKVMETLKPENWLIIYQKHFFELDNETYFGNWKGYRHDMGYYGFDGGSKMICR